MNRSFRNAGVALVCLAVVLVLGGCPPVVEPPAGRGSFAAAPRFNPSGGHFDAPINVSITCETEESTVYYTTDGSAPSDTKGQPYTDPIRVEQNMSIKAIAYAPDVDPSLTILSVYTIGGNQPPRITSATAAGKLTPGQIGFLAVSCKASDDDGYVRSVTVDCSSLSANPSQPLNHQDGDAWAWQGKVQPMAFGTYKVVITATDDQGEQTVVEAAVDVDIEPGQQKWAYATGGTVRSSPAIAADGTIYVGSEDRYLYAFNADGTLRWSFYATAAVVATPAIGSDGTIYVGASSYLFAINPDGTMKWNYAVGGPVYSSAAIGTHDVVYFGSNDGNLYAVDAAGKRKWTFATGGPIGSSPAIGSDGTIYVGSNDGKVYAVYPNGKMRWNYQTGGPISSNPAIDEDGSIYIGSADGNVYGLRPGGTTKWQSWRGSAVLSSPVLASNGQIYIGCSGGNFCAIKSSDGTLVWNYLTPRAIAGSAAVALDGTVYFGSGDHKLYAMTSTGSVIWTFDANLGVNSSPAIGWDGAIYVGTDDRRMLAVQGVAQPDYSPWPVARGSQYRRAAAVGLPADNLLPAFLAAPVISSTPAAVPGRSSQITISCQAEDFDGTLTLITADLSSIGGSTSQALTLGAAGTYQWSGSLTPAVPGARKVVVTIRDDAGATATAEGTLQVTPKPTIVDPAGPVSLIWSQPATVTVTCDAHEVAGSIQTVTANLSTIGGPAAQALRNDFGNHYTWTGSVTPMVSGNRTFVITATDNNNVKVTGNAIVNVGPLVTDISVTATGEMFNNRPADLTVSCKAVNEDNSVTSVTADLSNVGGAADTPLTKGAGNVWTWSGTVTPLSAGSQTIAVVATDSRGGKTTATTSVTVTAAPVLSGLSITQPLIREKATSITVSCRATNPVGPVTSVVANLVAVGGAASEALTLGQDNIWSWTGTLTTPAAGPSSISFTATNGGNAQTTAAVDFTFLKASLAIYSPKVKGSLVVLQPGTITVTCLPVSTNGTVSQVTADLSTLGVAGVLPMQDLGAGTWSLTRAITAPAAGAMTITLTGRDSNDRVAVATVLAYVTADTLWTFASQLQAMSSPAVLANGTVYIGLYGASFNGLLAINPDGTPKWQYPTPSRIQSSPAVGRDGSIYVGCDDWKVYAIKPDGTLKWTYATGGIVKSSPAIGADYVIYVGSNDGKVHAIDPDTGTAVWPAPFTTGGNVTSSPAVSEDGAVVYIGSWDEKVYAIKTVDGTESWQYKVKGIIDSAPAVAGDVIYVSDLAGYLYAINRLDGKENWNKRLDGRLLSSPSVGIDGTIYVGADDGSLYAIRADSEQIWAFATGGAVQSTPAIAADGTVYVGSNNNALFAINSNGTQKWKYATPDAMRSSPAIGATGTVYVASFDGNIYAIQGTSGLADSPWPMFRRGPLHSGCVGGR